jgi:hypothetical protein
MNPTDYEINIKPIKPFVYELLVKHKVTGVRYGTMCQSPHPPTIDGALQAFIQQPKNFFIDIDSEVVKDIPPVEVVVESPTTASVGV